MSRVGPAGAGVLLLHGIGLHPLLLSLLARDLRRAGFAPVLNWRYPRRSPGIAAVAAGLAARLARHFPEGPPRLHGVGHSMGGLILRRLLADGALPPGGRLVTLGTPHRGARKAGVFGNRRLYRLLFAGAGQDLRPGSPFLRSLPPEPPGPALAVAGVRGNGRGWSRHVPGDDDGVVGLDETLWPGARTLVVPRVLHSLLPLSPRVRRAVVAFLREDGVGAGPGSEGQAAGRA